MRLRELAGLSRGLRWRLRDERQHDVVLSSPTGLAALLDRTWLNERHVFSSPRLDVPIIVSGRDDTCSIDAAITWRHGRGSQVDSFVNLQRTSGGVHVTGLLAGLDDAQQLLQTLHKGDDANWATSGLHAVIHARITAGTSFANPTKDTLAEPDISAQVRRWVCDAVTDHFTAEPACLRALLSAT